MSIDKSTNNEAVNNTAATLSPLLPIANAEVGRRAVTGLFGRFYRESVAGTAVDDFGFSTARLVATPLLSGLAGVGGVMLTEMLASMGSTLATANTLGLGDIFRMDPRLFFVAAVFGLTPNLLIKGLQEKASKYETDIRSSKAAEPTTSTRTG